MLPTQGLGLGDLNLTVKLLKLKRPKVINKDQLYCKHLSWARLVSGQQPLVRVVASLESELKRRNMKGFMAELMTVEMPSTACVGIRGV